jgi:hypothetical protein
MAEIMKCDKCGYETSANDDFKFCPKCSSNSLKKINEQDIIAKKESEIREKIRKDVMDEISNLITRKEISSLLSNGWKIADEVPIKALKGLKNIKNKLCIMSRDVVSVIIKADIDGKMKIAEYPLEYLKIAEKLGAESIVIMEKDYPCYGRLPDGEVIVIAPRVNDDA